MGYVYVTKEEFDDVVRSQHPFHPRRFVILPEIGDVVDVVSGPWKGSVGIVDAINHTNAVVTLSIEQGETLTNTIYIHPEHLK